MDISEIFPNIANSTVEKSIRIPLIDKATYELDLCTENLAFGELIYNLILILKLQEFITDARNIAPTNLKYLQNIPTNTGIT